MIKSMTAYARSEKVRNKITVSVEIRSYNSRQLDIAVRLPHDFLSLEEKIKSAISEKLVRGRIETTLHIKEDAGELVGFEINENLAKAYFDVLDKLKKTFAIEDPITLSMLSAASGIIRPAEVRRDMADCWEAIEPCLLESLADLDLMRQKEGSVIAEDFNDRLVFIENCIDRIESATRDLLPHYKRRLERRIRELTEGLIEIETDRIVQEAAILADRSDISEEIVRSRSHIMQFREIMNSNESDGRKLNFLVQELNREFNTMGAKATLADVSHIIVGLKSELEKIREQVQNVE